MDGILPQEMKRHTGSKEMNGVFILIHPPTSNYFAEMGVIPARSLGQKMASGDSMISERLVDMQHHNYKTEPNVHFSPDGKWIIFRATFEGHTDVYAVEVKKWK